MGTTMMMKLERVEVWSIDLTITGHVFIVLPPISSSCLSYSFVFSPVTLNLSRCKKNILQKMQINCCEIVKYFKNIS